MNIFKSVYYWIITLCFITIFSLLCAVAFAGGFPSGEEVKLSVLMVVVFIVFSSANSIREVRISIMSRENELDARYIAMLESSLKASAEEVSGLTSLMKVVEASLAIRDRMSRDDALANEKKAVCGICGAIEDISVMVHDEECSWCCAKHYSESDLLDLAMHDEGTATATKKPAAESLKQNA